MLKRLPFYHSRACRVCGSESLEPYLDLGTHPPADRFITPDQIAEESAYPLRLHRCPGCGLSQLVDHIRFADTVEEYTYRTASSRALAGALQAFGAALVAEFAASGALVCDIGCNDGTMLTVAAAAGCRTVGVDPAPAAAAARAAGHEVIAAFFDAPLAVRITDAHGPASLVLATNVLNYLDDIAGFIAGVARLLGPDGVFAAEFSYLRAVIDNVWFDTVYHEHILYLSLTPFARLLAMAGLRPFRASETEIGASGTALRVLACRADAPHRDDGSVAALLADEAQWGIRDPGRYAGFAGRVATVRRRLLAVMDEVRQAGGTIGAFGAPAKGNTLLNYLGLTAADIACACDANPAKVGKLTPGSHIPVVDDAAFLDRGLSHALLLPWNYAAFFLEKAEFIRRGGRFIVPLPEPSIRP